MAPEPLRPVLVTGGAGYIGSHVVFVLLQTRKYKVISIDNYHNSYPEALKRVSELAKDELPADASEQDRESAEVDSFSGDLTQAADVRAIFEKYGKGGIWGVIHIAAYKAVGESSEIPLTYYANNVGATIQLCQIMSEFDCTRFVYSSSATVYGIPPIIPIPESTPLKADSVYGRTKVMSETVLQDLCHAEPDTWRVISLRYFNPAGAHPSGRIGEDPRGRPGNLLPLLSQMAVGRVKDAELKVFGNDYPTHDGTCVRDYLHVMDLASGHLLALEALASTSHPAFANLPDRAKYKGYNLGRGAGQSVLDIVNAMRKATGKDYKTRVIGRRLGDVPDLTADPALAEKELGFHASQDLETMCKDLWNWQSKNPEGYSTPEAQHVDITTHDWVKVPSAASISPEANEKSELPKSSEDSEQPQPEVTSDAMNSTFVMHCPTIPTLAALHDPCTPAYLSPHSAGTPTESSQAPKTPVADIQTAVVEGEGVKELTPSDVFIDKKVVEAL
ncbi:UDP-glucose-4-epimerase [Tulasnella sp. JGI-2019a]|nr:UDP-glucose-4-epimerase [Tulasnella sp. JGI-2019a]KAG8999798.1 UDP-glucose-4-epimerase [Tulasnella sp. JGI-2019a]KAG9028311.1 UDP-glucose-4-epimerase [Tulasnella sp. JGI-2019a]